MHAYRDGQFEEAVSKLLEARKLAPKEPVLLYNLARAYEALGRWNEAADAYAQYLVEEPSTPDRKAIEGKITTLRGVQPQDPTTPPPQPPQTPPPPPPIPSRSLVPWVVAGAGVATMATGFVIYGLAQGKHSDAVDDPIQQSAAAKQDSAQSLAQASTATILIGGVITLAGVAWIVVQMSSSSKQSASSITPFRVTF